MRFVFFLRAGPDIGHGHFHRCRVLIHEFEKYGYDCFVITDELTAKSYSEFFGKIKTQVVDWPPSTNIKSILPEDILLFDLPESDYIKFKGYSASPQFKVSINMFRSYGVPRFENLSLFPEFSKLRRKKIDTKIIQCEGVDYLIVDERFFRKKKKVESTCLITMGGADPLNITSSIISLITSESFKSKFEFDVIIPKHFDTSLLDVRVLNKKKVKIKSFGSVNLSEDLGKYQMAIISGGITRYECVASDTPFIAISIHEQQKNLTQMVSRFGYGLNLGVFNEKALEKLKTILSQKIIFGKKNEQEIQEVSLKKNAPQLILNTILSEKIKYENE